MKLKNPMHRAEIRDKVRTTLRAIGHRPLVRGGNGRPPTVPERTLAEALGWTISLIVPTGGRGSGLPTHFKVDVGNQLLKVAVEIDGGSHTALVRQAQDKRKTEWLESRGWKVIRFKNAEVMGKLNECVEKVRGLIAL